jgi:CBS domain-containing protein
MSTNDYDIMNYPLYEDNNKIKEENIFLTYQEIFGLFFFLQTILYYVRQLSISMNALDLMSVNVVAAKQNLAASEISARLLVGEFNGVPVVDDKQKVIGIVTAIDILKALREGKNLNNTTARDIMTPNPSVVKKDTSIEEIIDIMVEKEIVLVPVVQEEDGKLIGVVARLDILRQKLNEGFVTIGERSGIAKT